MRLLQLGTARLTCRPSIRVVGYKRWLRLACPLLSSPQTLLDVDKLAQIKNGLVDLLTGHIYTVLWRIRRGEESIIDALSDSDTVVSEYDTFMEKRCGISCIVLIDECIIQSLRAIL